MIQRVLFVAVLAGLVAGIMHTAVQLTRVTPLILHAEEFENADAPPAAAQSAAKHDHASHDHDEEPWAPGDGLERNAYSLLASVITAIGFGMLLTAAFALHGGPVGLGRGVLWGLAGFTVFWLAPALSLPPELPGMKAAGLLDRQLWYLGTVVATGVGLAIIVFRGGWLPRVAGAALIVVPHIVGAPHPHEIGGNAPPELAAMFVVASLLSAVVLWVVLGGVGGYLFDRFAKSA